MSFYKLTSTPTIALHFHVTLPQMKPQTLSKPPPMWVADQELLYPPHFRPYIAYNIVLEAKETDKLLRPSYWIVPKGRP